jgi:anti-sigma regulatory factor (Ser/Thr protein kinase)
VETLDAIQEGFALPINEPSQASEARRIASRLAARFGFSEIQTGEVALVTTEAATNLLKHATAGMLVMRALRSGSNHCIELIALDHGPGISDPERCMVDGFSTASSPGTGLGAIRRLSTTFDFYSIPTKGTVLFSRIWSAPPAREAFETGGIGVPKSGETICGDAWGSDVDGERLSVAVIDGLGHGPDAAVASHAALAAFRRSPGRTPAEIIESMHGALRSTRGAAIAIASINRDRGRVLYCGVGNISGTILSAGRIQRMVSHNGTVGHALRKVQEFQYTIEPNDLLVMHSDGISAGWTIEEYSGVLRHHPAILAASIYRDHCRGRDDATVVVVRPVRGEP